MIDNFETIKAYVLTLGDFEESPKLDLQIEMIINECLAYCYRCDVPPCMELPLADVIVTELNKASSVISSIGIDGQVSSYKEGDMSISYATGSSTTTTTETTKYNGKLESFKQIIGAIKCSENTNAR